MHRLRRVARLYKFTRSEFSDQLWASNVSEIDLRSLEEGVIGVWSVQYCALHLCEHIFEFPVPGTQLICINKMHDQYVFIHFIGLRAAIQNGHI